MKKHHKHKHSTIPQQIIFELRIFNDYNFEININKSIYDAIIFLLIIAIVAIIILLCYLNIFRLPNK